MTVGTNKVVGFLQKLGKAIMTPICVLPVAGLLLRIGQPDIWGNLFSGNGIPWMVAAGEAIIDQMALLFAIGISIGLAEDNNGNAALAGAVGYFIFTQVSHAFAAQLYVNISNGDKFEVGILAGVLSGIIAGILYNRYKEIKLPEFLGFFGGKRFIPVVTSFVMLILALLFGWIWPNVQDKINDFGNVMATSGIIGTFGFGCLNRLLIPFGLHHILNSVFWFQFGEFSTANGVVTGDILRFMNGDPTAGIFQTGFFPITMFALPAACLAMIVAANKEKRKNVAVILGGMAFTSFFTGITEPIEFTFLFISPLLYVIHSILTGISLAVTSFLGMRHGFSFSAGLLDYLLNYNIAEKPIALALIGLLFSIVYFIIFYYIIVKFNLPTPGRGEDVEDKIKEERVKHPTSDLDNVAIGIVNAVGGKRNIEYVDSCITRIRLKLKDANKVDRSGLKKVGASGIVKMGTNNIQIIIGTMADPIVSRIKKIK